MQINDKNKDNQESAPTFGDGIDRRGFLKCMAWAGTGVLLLMRGGILQSVNLSDPSSVAHAADLAKTADFSFVQISDSHIGFSKPANPDVVGTLNLAINKIKSLPVQPDFLLHTGDLTHLSQDDEFDTLAQALSGAGLNQVHYVPGEHDVETDDGKLYLQRYGKGTKGSGWYSFDYAGTHFVGLNNVVDLKTNGIGSLGADQIAWMKDDLSGVSSDTPIVVFAHIPLWSVYPEWGWGTSDSAQAISLLRRFGSVTVLNGHIHQTMQKIDGNITFHTATSTAFPQPKPGEAPSPGPMKVPAGELRGLLGITTITSKPVNGPLAIIDSSLA